MPFDDATQAQLQAMAAGQPAQVSLNPGLELAPVAPGPAPVPTAPPPPTQKYKSVANEIRAQGGQVPDSMWFGAPKAPEPKLGQDQLVFNQPQAAGGAPGAAPALNLSGIAAPAQRIPAAWVPQGRETQTQGGVQYSPEVKSALEQYAKANADVQQAQAELLQQQAVQGRTEAIANAKQAQGDYEEFQARNARHQAMLSEQRGKVQAARQAMDEANAQGVDPGHWWANKGVGSKIAMTIGALAGGWLVGTGRAGQNPALETINREIDRDIDAQKQNIAGKGRSFENEMSLYSLMRQQGLDEDQAADGAKLLAHQQLQAQLQAAAADTKNAAGKLELAQSLQNNAQKLAELQGKFDEKSSARVVSSSSEKYRPEATVGGGPVDILKLAGELYNKNYGKEGNSWEEAVRNAVRQKTGKDIAPGSPELRILEQKGGAGAGRMGRFVMQHQANIQALEELGKLSKDTVIGPQSAGRANFLVKQLKANGIEGLPDEVGMLSGGRFSGATQAAIDQAIRDQRARLSAAQQVIAGGGGVGGSEEEPEGFEEK